MVKEPRRCLDCKVSLEGTHIRKLRCADCQIVRTRERKKFLKASRPPNTLTHVSRKPRDVAGDLARERTQEPLPSCRGMKPHHWILDEYRGGLTPGRCKRCRRRYTFADPFLTRSIGWNESASMNKESSYRDDRKRRRAESLQ